MTSTNIIPEVGNGATVGVGSDCYACTIIEVSKNLKRVKVQFDIATPAPGYDYFRNQVYTFERNPGGQVFEFTLRKDGYWRAKNSSTNTLQFSLKGRHHYSDPSF